MGKFYTDGEYLFSVTLASSGDEAILTRAQLDLLNAYCASTYYNGHKYQHALTKVVDGNGDPMTDANLYALKVSTRNANIYGNSKAEAAYYWGYTSQLSESGVFTLPDIGSINYEPINSTEYTSVSVIAHAASGYPIKVSFYQLLFNHSIQKLDGQGVIINGANAGRVTGVVYEGLGGNFDSHLSPIKPGYLVKLLVKAETPVDVKNFILSPDSYRMLIEDEDYGMTIDYLLPNTGTGTGSSYLWNNNGSTVGSSVRAKYGITGVTAGTGRSKGIYRWKGPREGYSFREARILENDVEYEIEADVYSEQPASEVDEWQIASVDNGNKPYAYTEGQWTHLSDSETAAGTATISMPAIYLRFKSGTQTLGKALSLQNVFLRRKSFVAMANLKNFKVYVGDYEMLEYIDLGHIGGRYYYVNTGIAVNSDTMMLSAELKILSEENGFCVFFGTESGSTPMWAMWSIMDYIGASGTSLPAVFSNYHSSRWKVEKTPTATIVNGTEVNTNTGSYTFNTYPFLLGAMPIQGFAGSVRFFHLVINGEMWVPATDGTDTGLLNLSTLVFYPALIVG